MLPAVALSTASIYPESTASAFDLASRLGYDAVEVMVGIDEISQDVDTLAHLSDYHEVPVVAIHAPCLLVTARVWGTDPWGKLERSAAAAKQLGAEVVVVHPPFRWQRDYARGFVEGIARLEQQTGVALAIENMYPWRTARRELQAYSPGWDPTDEEYAHTTLDLSHTATAGNDPLLLLDELGPRLTHIHMADGTGSAKDEHLVPGRGSQPCAQVLQRLGAQGFAGHVVVEINTRRCPNRSAREADLVEALSYIRMHLGPVGTAEQATQA